MPSGSLAALARVTSPCVALFIREVLTIYVAPHVPPPSPRAVPLSYLHFLYEAWRRHRGASDYYRLTSQRTFSSVVTRLNPDFCGVPPLPPTFPVGRASVRCTFVTLNPKPVIVRQSPNHPLVTRECDGQPLGVGSGPFCLPGVNQLPPDILYDLEVVSRVKVRAPRFRAC